MPASESGSQRRTSAPSRAIRELRRAERLAESGQVAEAIRTLDTAIQCGADPYVCYLRQARLYQTRQQLSEAVSAAEKAIAAHPEKISAREALIALYLESRNYEGAIGASHDLIKISPKHLAARDALGAAYIGMGNLDAAMRVANELILIDPNDAAHHFKKALLCQHSGDLAVAVQEFGRVLDMDPEGDLAPTAMDQLQELDGFQLNQIVTLAMEDAVFRAKLFRDAEDAVTERGYFLSEGGVGILRQIAEQMFTEQSHDTRLNLYH